MVIKTQTKQKKSKSQLRKTLKHYSKTNKKGGRWGSKKGNQIHNNNHIMPPPPVNTFANETGVKRNPLYKRNKNNQYNPQNNSNLPSEVNTSSFFNRELYGNTGSSKFIYNNSQSLFSGKSNNGSSNGYVSLGSGSNQYNPYTPMNPIYNNLSQNKTVGEAKLRKQINNGNLLNATAKA